MWPYLWDTSVWMVFHCPFLLTHAGLIFTGEGGSGWDHGIQRNCKKKYQGIFKQFIMDHINVLSWLAGMSKLRWKEIHIVYPGRAGVWKQYIEKMAGGNLKLSDNIRCHRSLLTTLIQAMVCSLMVSNFLNQRWLIINKKHSESENIHHA